MSEELMTEVSDTKSNANEPASKAHGDERAAASNGEVFESIDADDTAHASAAVSADAADASSFAAPSIAAPGIALDTQHHPAIEPLVLQPDLKAGDRSQYHVTELLAYHDQHFVESVYKAITARAPSHAELARELDELRSGRESKVEIIERLLSSQEARAGSERRVRVEGLPSPLMRRLGRVPVIGYALRLVRALVRLPLSMQHQQQFEIYALAQQQLIADYMNRTLAQVARGNEAVSEAPTPQFVAPSQQEEVAEALAMFSDALLELSNSHAELQEQTQTQAAQAEVALAELTAAISAHQQLADTFRREQQLAIDALSREQQLAADALSHQQQLTADALRREQQLAADAQQEFLIQEQQVIVETQKVLLEELREELRQLSARQQRARDEFDAEVRRLRSLREAAARENFSGEA